MTDSPTWSFSSIKKFNQCPRQYYEMRVAKNFKEEEGEAARYGKLFHTAAENFIKDGTPIPPEFEFAAPVLDTLNRLPGEKFCEYGMGLTVGLEPCAIDAPDVWFRGIADLITIHKGTARCLDYKTGKSAQYADTGQLELMALAIFRHFPPVQVVKGGLLFVMARQFVPAEYRRTDVPKLLGKWLTQYTGLQQAFRDNRWNARESGLCRKHCAVLTCPHNGRS